MSIITKIKSSASDFRSGMSIIFGKTEEGKGDRRLAKASKIVMGQINIYGKDAVRRSVVKSIYSDLKRAYKKGGKNGIEDMINNAVGTPEYMEMLHKLNMDKTHLWGAANELMAGR